MYLRKLTIGLRLFLGFGSVIIIGALAALVYTYSLTAATEVAEKIRSENFPSALLAEEMAFNTEAVQQFLTDVGATRDPEAFKEAEEAAAGFRQGVVTFREIFRKRNDAASLKKLEEIERDFDSFYEQGKVMAKAYIEEGTEGGNRIMRDFDRNSELISNEVRDFKKMQTKEANHLLLQLCSQLAKAKIFVGILGVCSLILGIIVSWRITRSIAAPVGEALKFASSVAQGDLSTTIEVKGGGEVAELTDALNRMVRSLNEMVSKIKGSSAGLAAISADILTVSGKVTTAASVQAGSVESTSSAMTEINSSIKGIATGVDTLTQSASETSSSIMELASSVEEVALNADTLANSAEEVSASIVETAAAIRQIDASAATLKEAYTCTAVSVEEMQASIRQVEQNAKGAAAIAAEVLADAEAGRAAVDETGAGIRKIRKASGITSNAIMALSGRTDEIGAIVSVIDEVAEQTNLLALNAAIIAAQAGAHGKGFAVVAEEIKELADRTTRSTQEIAGVIRIVQKEMEEAVKAISVAETSISDGEDLSKKSGEALAKIVAGVRKASDEVAEIASATVEQTRGSLLITEAMHQVSQMVDQIAKATGEQRKGSELMMAAIERMKELTTQVRNSTREQSSTGGFIAESNTQVMEMIRHVHSACEEQSRGSGQIIFAVENIRESTKVTVDASRVMDEAVSRMSVEIKTLEKEMAAFSVA